MDAAACASDAVPSDGMTKAISATSQKRERDRVICRNTTPVGYRLTSQ